MSIVSPMRNCVLPLAVSTRSDTSGDWASALPASSIRRTHFVLMAGTLARWQPACYRYRQSILTMRAAALALILAGTLTAQFKSNVPW